MTGISAIEASGKAADGNEPACELIPQDEPILAS